MSTMAAILIFAAVAGIAAAAWFAYRKQHRYAGGEAMENALPLSWGPVATIHIRSLSRDDREQFIARWEEVQRGFAGYPAGAIHESESLLHEVMRARGYPMSNWEYRAEDISVDHPEIVQNYRLAQAIADRHNRGQATAGDLAQALTHYRDLFDELLEIQLIAMRKSQ